MKKLSKPITKLVLVSSYRSMKSSALFTVLILLLQQPSRNVKLPLAKW